MDYKLLIPVYGTASSLEDLTDESIPFAKRVEIAVLAGSISGVQAIFAYEMGLISLGQVKAYQAAFSAAPAVTATAGLAALTYATTKKGATVEHGPYGSVKVVPKLGLF